MAVFPSTYVRKARSMTILAAIPFILALDIVRCLKCFHCMSTSSWEECGGSQKVQDCPAHYTRCLNATIILPPSNGAEIKQYIRGCNMKKICDRLERATEECKNLTSDSPRGENITCDATCCTVDLCNESAVMTTSSIMLVACITWALAR